MSIQFAYCVTKDQEVLNDLTLLYYSQLGTYNLIFKCGVLKGTKNFVFPLGPGEGGTLQVILLVVLFFIFTYCQNENFKLLIHEIIVVSEIPVDIVFSGWQLPLLFIKCEY